MKIAGMTFDKVDNETYNLRLYTDNNATTISEFLLYLDKNGYERFYTKDNHDSIIYLNEVRNKTVVINTKTVIDHKRNAVHEIKVYNECLVYNAEDE